MKTISNVFGPARPSISRWISDYDDVHRALWELRGLELPTRPFIGSLRASKMRDRDGVFSQFGALLQFPPYFGENWNAFRDCIFDLDWLRADAFVLAVLDAEQLLVDGDVDELGLLLEILRDAAESMSQLTSFGPAKPFRVFLHARPLHSTELEERLRSVQIPVVDADSSG